ncbi:TPA: helix-turn-helix domain-containing protein, partial [Pseudomonas aeruginosa]|nr:helix-turn-helix domain-containing protein [Pseudomonas aeruginosa]
MPVSLDSLYTWLSRYEQQGLLALMRRPRRDAGRRLVQVTRRWDKACPLPADVQSTLA